MSPCVRYGGAIAAVASMPGEPLQISDMHLLTHARSGPSSRLNRCPDAAICPCLVAFSGNALPDSRGSLLTPSDSGELPS